MVELSQLSRRQVLAGVLAMGMGLVSSRGAVASDFSGVLLLRVGFLRNYAPFSFVDKDGQLRGFDVDVHQSMCQAMGWQLQAESGSLLQLQKKLQNNEIVGIGNQLLMSPENRRRFDFVRPAYASIQLCAVQHEEDRRDFLSMEDLIGMRLGVLAQTGIEAQARGVLGEAVRAYPHVELALRDLAEHRLDVVLEEGLIADYLIERERLPLKVMAPFSAPTEVGLVVRKGDQAMLTHWSRGVSTLLRNGTLAKISRHWFGYDVSQHRVVGYIESFFRASTKNC